jgi:hypothetical protein
MKVGKLSPQGSVAGTVAEIGGAKEIYGSRDIDNSASGNVTDLLTRDGVEATIAAAGTPAHASTHANGGADEVSVAGLSGVLADNQNPVAHASGHTDGSDDIQDATNAQKGVATAAQITALEANTSASHAAATGTPGASEVLVSVSGQQISASIVSASVHPDKLNAAANASLDLADSASQPGIVQLVNTGTSYDPILTDADKMVTMDNASANTFTVGLGPSVSLPIGSTIGVMQIGAGITTIEAATGVTLNGVSAGSVALTGQWRSVMVWKVGANSWYVMGSIGTVA